MGPFLSSILFALGAGAWVYNQVQKRNGGQSQQSITVAAVCGVIAWIVFLSLFSAVNSQMSG